MKAPEETDAIPAAVMDGIRQAGDQGEPEPSAESAPESDQAADPAEKLLETQRLGPWSKKCKAIPNGFVIPIGWKCDLHGIHKKIQRKDAEIDVRVAYGPILPVATYTDPTGSQLVELAWWDGLRWVNRLVARSIAKAGKKLVATLGDSGFPATDGSGRDVEQWLASTEALNRGVIPDRSVARWLGWQGDGTFLTGAEGAHIEVAYEEQQAAMKAHHAKGALDAWQAAIATLDPFPIVKVALYAGFASPLLEILKVDSFMIDFSGLSTRGKTTAAKMALSCWADPSEDGDGVFNWNATLLIIEKRLNLVRGLPVLLDETRLVKTPDLVDEVIYQVSKNHGRARSGGYPSLLPWSTIVLSTGEQPALSFTTHQGASVRVLGITRPPFGAGTPENGALAEAAGKAVDEHYGNAGPAFVAELQKLLRTKGGKAGLVRRHRELVEKVRGPNDLSARRAPQVAALVLAAELVSQWGITPRLAVPKPSVWLSLFAGSEPTDNRPEMALDIALEWVGSMHFALWSPGTNRPPPASGWIGRTLEIDDQSTVAVLPERLKAALTKSEITLAAVLPAWKERGWLVKSGDKDRPWDTKRRLGSSNIRMFVFHPEQVGQLADSPDGHSVSKASG